MTNADLWLTDWPKGGKVHRGFRKALDEVWEELHAYLAQLKRGGRRIWMTGHSLGAALATLAADLHGEVQGLYTFGSPRVGNARFKECYSVRRAYRFVNGSDIVAQLPPPGFYAHVGEPQFIDREGNIRPRPDEGAGDEETASAENKDVSNGSDWVPGPVLDHVPLRYAIRIWNHLMSME
jgi:pimeloyl-ACP methyl ester carboxylesterase